jgi:GNAT superfamily N-acetyltransferase
MSAKANQDSVSIHARNADGGAAPSWIRKAALPDTGAIVSRMNSAYRPSASQRGWTHEADILAGSRIDPAQVTELFLRPDSVILVGHHETRLVACVHVQKTGLSSYISMLALHPESQGLGVGSQMLSLPSAISALLRLFASLCLPFGQPPAGYLRYATVRSARLRPLT